MVWYLAFALLLGSLLLGWWVSGTGGYAPTPAGKLLAERAKAQLGGFPDAAHRNARTGGPVVRNKYGALLKGLLRCTACGCRMASRSKPSR